MGFLGKFVGLVGVLQRSLRMPFPRFVISFFIMLCGRAMGPRCKFVQLGGLPVCVVHALSFRYSLCTKQTNLFPVGIG